MTTPDFLVTQYETVEASLTMLCDKKPAAGGWCNLSLEKRDQSDQSA